MNHERHEKKKPQMDTDEHGLDETTCLRGDTHRQAARSVDIALVVRNWLFGWYIVAFEKAGASRKELYGKTLMPKLAKQLTEKLGKGFLFEARQK